MFAGMMSVTVAEANILFSNDAPVYTVAASQSNMAQRVKDKIDIFISLQ